MAGAHTLTEAEIGIIKTMLRMFPNFSKQAILSYFTRPGRDLNHRLIAEIQSGRWPNVAPARVVEVMAFLKAFTFVDYPRAQDFSAHHENGSVLRTIAGLELHWWPVGQGLFHSGRLLGLTGRTYHWVYDCGSSSKGKIRDDAIAEYRKPHRRRINLVTLSHFDKDHINGIEALVHGIRVDKMLLPYLPMHDRLLIAIAEGIDVGEPLFEFFVDPAAYLTGLDGNDIGEIVFVPAAGPDDSAPGEADEGPVDPDFPIDEPKIDEGKPPKEFSDDPIGRGSGQGKTRFLRPGGRIFIPQLWEFVPYNDAELQPKATPSFERRARRLARNFATKLTRRDAALKLLKRLYDKTFGGRSRPRNLVSLFLYSGPVGDPVSLATYWATAPVRLNDANDNFAQLSTGDGYLKTAAQLNALRHFYRNERRLERSGIFQVMHHGARGNWHKGVAAAVKPAVSIFSSNPVRVPWGHPHAEVLRDFWSWSPVQVDEVQSFHFLATLGLRAPRL